MSLLILLLALAAGPATAATTISAPRVHHPSLVYVGGYVNDVPDLDIKTHSYHFDLYLWFRWRDPKIDPAKSLEFTNPYELSGHARTYSFEKPIRLPNGDFYQVSRHQGRFSHKLRMNDYPFDKQELIVEFEDEVLASEELEFAPDPRGLTVNPALDLPGFKIGLPRLTVDNYNYPTEFGDPRLEHGERYSRVTVGVQLSREVGAYTLKLIAPVLCVFLTASLMFLLHPKSVDARAGIGITALLTVVALQFTLKNDLPEVGYLILMDKIFLATYLFVLAGLATVLKSTRIYEAGNEKAAAFLSLRALIASSTIYIGTVLGLILLSLR